jgi:hypothetical protein
VDSDQARTINFTDDGHVEVDRGQGTSFVEDALPSADMNDADESTPVSDDGITAVIWYIRIVFFCVLTNRFYSYTIITDRG